ncbi:MAG TPA: UDP-galactopyranose mutase, partial [Bryobacteraceae bacterium]|nr:UDP-galactopyranose mutase [Bryobacteraceae bacterium]
DMTNGAWLIVGAGFTGCTLAERIANVLGRKVVLVERRPHIGGNAFDYYDESGVLVHAYGPHIFHTNSRKVWEYLSRFTEWRRYEHRVLAVVDGMRVPVPFNVNSIRTCFPAAAAAQIVGRLLRYYGWGANVPILTLRQHHDGYIRLLADYVYEKIFYEYTLKQWELPPDELDPLVTGRVPVRVSLDDRYFQDIYQAMPANGYTALFQRMLDHPNIEVVLGTDYRQLAPAREFKRIIYTGMIDEFFEFRRGPLPYRSLRFDFVTLNKERFQEVGTVNYPNGQPFTRISELKHITGQVVENKTTITVEYPERYAPGCNEPYYPIPRKDNRAHYLTYLEEAQKTNGAVLFAGRLGDYKYYNMDQAVGRALQLFESIAAAEGV